MWVYFITTHIGLCYRKNRRAVYVLSSHIKVTKANFKILRGKGQNFKWDPQMLNYARWLFQAVELWCKESDDNLLDSVATDLSQKNGIIPRLPVFVSLGCAHLCNRYAVPATGASSVLVWRMRHLQHTSLKSEENTFNHVTIINVSLFSTSSVMDRGLYKSSSV